MDLIPRTKALGAIVVETPAHFCLTEISVRRWGVERAAKMLPFQSLLDAGIPVVIATDGTPGDPESNLFCTCWMRLRIRTNRRSP